MYNPVAVSRNERAFHQHVDTTLTSDLSLTAEELMMCCDRNVRNEIRRAAKDGAVCKRFLSDDLIQNQELITQFDSAYAEMHRNKDMPVVSVAGYMYELLRAGALALSICEIDGTIVANHVYVVGDGVARLLYSVSVFRSTQDGAWRTAVGRANVCCTTKICCGSKMMAIGYMIGVDMLQMEPLKALMHLKKALEGQRVLSIVPWS